MKLTLLISALLGLAALPAAAAERAPTPKSPVRDAATHEQIVESGRQAAAKAAEEKKEPLFKPASDAQMKREAKLREEPRSLLAVSDIICYNGLATMVPKRSVLHVPKNLADRIGLKEGVRFVTFQEFMAGNRAWLTNSAVNRSQAEGNEPLSEATLKSFAKETRIVVATYYEGPISVLPLKVPATTTPAAAGAPAATAAGTPAAAVKPTPTAATTR